MNRFRATIIEAFEPYRLIARGVTRLFGKLATLTLVAWGWLKALRRMPRYLALDLIGKALVLMSVGWQLMVLTPLADERNYSMWLKQTALLQAMHYKLYPPKYVSDPLKDSEEVGNVQWETFIDADKKIKELRPRQVAQKDIVLSLFVIGSILTILGTLFEKRNKPAS